MALDIYGVAIERVAVVDDDRRVRASYEFPIEDLSLVPVQQEGPLMDIDGFVCGASSQFQAAVCDHHLRVSNYASFDGAELVARFYQAHMPAILCTRWEQARLEDIRRYRRFIPFLVKPDDLSPATLEYGFRVCIEEFRDSFAASRRSWRTVVRVADVQRDRSLLDVVVPGWNPHEVVRLRMDEIPSRLQAALAPEKRLTAHVNIGAETQEELFFEKWEE
jgi:hypothetical protein